MREGHAVIWDMGVAHANFANYSSESRLTQYVRMTPNMPWAIEKERQSICKYWKQDPVTKEKIKKLNWSDKEKKMLGLSKF